MKALAAFLVAVLVLATATSGCLDINLAKNLLVPEEEKPLEYGIRTIDFNHTFESVIYPSLDPIEYFDGEQAIIVKPHTTQMGVTINVKFVSLGVDPPPEADPIMDLLADRYVKITLYTPKGDAWFNKTYNETVDLDTIPLIPNPERGNWTLAAKGKGIGWGEYVDSFTVEVRVNEPVG